MLDLRTRVEIKPEDLLEKLDVNDRETMDTFEKVFPHWAELILRQIKKNVRGGGLLNRRTGMLIRAAEQMDYVVNRLKESFEVILRLFVAYGYVQEVGTEGKGGELPDIKPVTKEYLTIPLPPALTPAGVVKNVALRAKEKGTSEYKKSFIRENKRKNLILYMKQGKGIIPLWVLKKSVALPATYWFATSVRQAMKYLPDLMAGDIEEAYEQK
jgi:hypothetical protein